MPSQHEQDEPDPAATQDASGDTVPPTTASFLDALATWLGERGAGFHLRPRDVEHARAWEASGVPVAVVIAAASRAFARLGDGAARRGLAAVVPDVAKAIDRHLRLHPPRPAHVAQPASSAEALRERLVEAGKAATDPCVREALRAGYRRLVAAFDANDPPHLAWSGSRDVIFEALVACLRADERAALQRDVERDPRYLSMSEAAAAAHRVAAQERWLARRFALEKLLS